MTIAGNDQGNLTGSFAGLRVLDFSTTIAGPHCTRMLADMGAEVIKVETEEGETMRTRPPVRNNCSTAFGQLNVGKNSLVLDLKSPAGLEAVRRLVATADALVENFRPGVMRRLKLDYASLHEANPKLVYCSISGYGQTGPSAELPAYAPVIHAASGYEMAHLAYQPGRSRPDYCGIYHADVLTGVYAFKPAARRPSTHSIVAAAKATPIKAARHGTRPCRCSSWKSVPRKSTISASSSLPRECSTQDRRSSRLQSTISRKEQTEASQLSAGGPVSASSARRSNSDMPRLLPI